MAVVLALVLGLAATGWLGFAKAHVARRRADRRLERVALAEHELRGPVAVLAITRERMERESTGRRYARALEVEVERLVAALADLTAARTGAPRVADARRAEQPARGRSSDLRAFAGGALAGWAPALRAVGRRTRFDWKAGPVPLPRDRGRVAQALGNLVANAAEHGTGEVEVRGRRMPGGIRVEVRNGVPDGPAGGRTPERGLGLSDGSGGGRTPERGLGLSDGSAGGRTPDRGLGLSIASDAARELGGDLVTDRDARTFRAALELPLSEASLRMRERLASSGPRRPLPTSSRPVARPATVGSVRGASASNQLAAKPAKRALKASPPGVKRPPGPGRSSPPRLPTPPRRVAGNRRRM
jgi:histidine kinase/DNA gyrase B/HSP90-like ATPase